MVDKETLSEEKRRQFEQQAPQPGYVPNKDHLDHSVERNEQPAFPPNPPTPVENLDHSGVTGPQGKGEQPEFPPAPPLSTANVDHTEKNPVDAGPGPTPRPPIKTAEGMSDMRARMAAAKETQAHRGDKVKAKPNTAKPRTAKATSSHHSDDHKAMKQRRARQARKGKYA